MLAYIANHRENRGINNDFGIHSKSQKTRMGGAEEFMKKWGKEE